MAVKVRVLKAEGINLPLTSENIKYCKKFGVELEGAWQDTRPDNVHSDASVNIPNPNQNNTSIHNCHVCIPHDFRRPSCLVNLAECTAQGHIHCEDNCTEIGHCDTSCTTTCNCARNSFHSGECISEPSSIEELRSWIEFNAPDIVNATCGLHVHVSMNKNKDYMRLTERPFYDFFLKWFQEWGQDMGFDRGHEFWKRLAGNNKYCKKEWKPEKQIKQTGKSDSRYTHLNFCYGHLDRNTGGPRQTLECRLFPAFSDAGTIMLAIESLVRCIETYLASTESDEQDKPVVVNAYVKPSKPTLLSRSNT